MRSTALALAAAISVLKSGEALACDSTRARWPNSATDVVRVWLQPPRSGGAGSAIDVGAARDAVGAWNAVGLPVRFGFTPDSATADVHVRWIVQFDGPMTGNTSCTFTTDNWILGADIVLAIHRPAGRRLNADEMRALALHEIGHALGLPHAADGVMAETARVRELQPTDRAAARRLYSVAPPRSP